MPVLDISKEDLVANSYNFVYLIVVYNISEILW